MNAKIIALFNHKGGVSKTTTTYHLGWKISTMGKRVLLVDGDPQCNLTRLALGEEYYDNTIFSATSKTIYDILKGIINGGADVDLSAELEEAKGSQKNLYLLRGNMRLSEYEDILYRLGKRII